MLTLFGFFLRSEISSCTIENTIFFSKVYLDLKHHPECYAFWIIFKSPKEYIFHLNCLSPLAKILFILGATRALRVFITNVPLEHHDQWWWLAIFTVKIVTVFTIKVFLWLSWESRMSRHLKIQWHWHKHMKCWDIPFFQWHVQMLVSFQKWCQDMEFSITTPIYIYIYIT